MHRFFITPAQVRGTQVHLEGEQAHQIAKVLRLRPEAHVRVLTNDGWEYELALQTVTRKRVVGAVVSRRPAPGEPTVHLTLYQSLLKRDNFEWVLQKGTELGVAAFVPLLTERSVVRLAELADNKRARWQRILAEAAEQAGRGRCPVLANPLDLQSALAALGPDTIALMPWENEPLLGVAAALARAREERGVELNRLALFVGPEGGFTDAEVAMARGQGIMPVTLGPRVLRAETAAVVATALLMHALQEMETGPER